ncbi:hypothetical protein ACGFYV_32245 [Streptomyces sp. NPDC048297]|uniref:hypothetical protein n=1 Tax=Streptomyces sp. NPDC048297 TaxID=3365531 RepID=UPI00371AE6C8
MWGQGLRVESMPLDTWRDRELPDVARDGLLIGINWSGPRLVGWSLTPMEVLNRLAAAHQGPSGGSRAEPEPAPGPDRGENRPLPYSC